MVSRSIRLAKQSRRALAGQQRQRGVFLAAAIVSLALVVTIGSLFIRRSILKSLGILQRGAGIVGTGDFHYRIGATTRDEFGQLAHAFDRMTENLKASTASRDELEKSRVELEKEVAERKRAEAVLSQQAEELEREDWLKTGQPELATVMAGEQDISHLGTNIMSLLARYLGAASGVLHVTDESGAMRVAGGYAYTPSVGRPEMYRSGEGLVGQAAIERRMLSLAKLPDDYFKVDIGLGEVVPTSLLIVPVVADDVVTGVIELGTFEPSTELHKLFLESVTKSIGIAINTAQARHKINELYAQSQSQALGGFGGEGGGVHR